MYRTLFALKKVSERTLVAALAFSLVAGPVAPVFVFKVHAVPPTGINLPAQDGVYNSASYITNERWGDTAVSCGYAYDVQGSEDGSGWTPISCTLNIPIPPPGTDGPHTLYIGAWDGADFTDSFYTWSVSFTYDTVAPEVSITSPIDALNIADADWGSPIVSWGDSTTCEYHYDGDSYSAPGSGCSSETDIPKPESGSRTLYVRGTDAAGNHTETSITFTLDAPVDGGGGGGGGGDSPTIGSVTTGSVSDITETTAVASGSVTSNGGAGIVQTGIVYDTVSHADGAYEDYAYVGHSDTPSLGDYTTNLVLSCGTTYYYRAFLINDVGYALGSEESFVTSDCGGGGGGADGSSGNPYHIATCSEFQAINNNLSSYFVLDNDISCESEGNAMRVGDSDHPFTGNFNGGGNRITVALDESSTNDMGLFAALNGATIHSVWVSGLVQGAAQTGAIAGYANQAAHIYNVASDATVVGHGVYVGGLVGAAESGTVIEDSYFKGALTGYANVVGGIVGFLHGSTVARTYFSGTITAAAIAVGGIAGLSYGQLDLSNTLVASHINDSFSVGAIEADNTDHAGILGEPSGGEDNIALSNNFYDSALTGLSLCQGGSRPGTESEKCEDITSTSLKQVTTGGPFATAPWDFTETWETVAHGYPALRSITDDETPVLDFDGGIGTTQNPYQIGSCDQLPLINSHLSRSFVLTQNLSCTEAGNTITIALSDPFTGTFDGASHTITYAKTGTAGLFHWTSGATIKNLGLGGSITDGGGVLGALVGHAVNTNISFVYSSTTVTSAGADQVGGLVGYLEGGSIRNSYATGAVSGTTWNIGGLVGLMNTAVISKSYAAGAVSGDEYVGGLVGSSFGDSSIIASFAANAISAANNYGGLIGKSNGAILTENYFDGWLNELGGTCASDDPGGCTTINGDGQSSAYFFNDHSNPPLTFWDFTSAWQANTDTYPTLRANPVDNTTDPVSYNGGDGSAETPYLIGSCEQLEGIGQDDAHLAAHYRLTDDIYCSATNQEGEVLNHNGAGFDPIGQAQSHPFTGVLDGADHNIYNLYINRPEEDSVGLFAYIANATIEHLYMHGGLITGGSSVGLVAGYAYASTLDEVETGYVQSVSGNSYVGGLVGIADATTIVDSNFDGNIFAGEYGGGLVGSFEGDGMNQNANGISDSRSSASITVTGEDGGDFGGLVGSLSSGYIHNSYVENDGDPVYIDGEAAGATYLGGLVGEAYNAQIIDSYAHAVVTGRSFLGGLVGAGNELFIEASHSVGSVQAGDSENHHPAVFGLGGLIGIGFTSVIILNAYSETEVSAYTGDSAEQFFGDSLFYGGLAGALCLFGGGCLVLESYSTGDVTIDQETSDGESSEIDGVGGLVGYLVGTGAPYIFTHNYASGDVQVTIHQNDNASSQQLQGVGGMYGVIQDANVSLSNASGNVIIDAPSASGIGGFVGEDNGVTYEDSFASGSLSLNARGDVFEKIGGFAGSESTESTILRSYASGDITPEENGGAYFSVGGLVGQQYGAIRNSFSTGNVATTTATFQVGGLVGDYQAVSEFDSLENNYYLTTPNSANAVCVGSDEAQQISINGVEVNKCTGIDSTDPGISYFYDATQAPMFDIWDFSNNGTWLEHSDTLPTLRGLQNPYTGSDFDGGNGTPESPYHIGSCAALDAINDDLGASYVLDHDLTCSHATPIGFQSEGGFHGTFDGGDNAITITINRDGQYYYTGLFSETYEAYVHDLTVHGSITGGQGYTGAIVGASYDSRLENLYSDATVQGGDRTGGIVGQTYGVNANDLAFEGSVVGTGEYTGGIIGRAQSNGFLFNLYFDGEVSGYEYTGGLIGQSTDTYLAGGSAFGTVTGTSAVGGAIGYLASNDGYVSRIMANAQVAGDEQVGGLIGFMGGVHLTDAYSKGTVRGYNSVGGLVGIELESTIERAYSTATVIGTGFDRQQNNIYLGGLTGQSAFSVIRDSFSSGEVKSITARTEGEPVYAPSADGDTYIGGFAAYFFGADEDLSNVYFDVLGSGQNVCESVHQTAGCTGINTEDAPNTTYFVANSSNAPLTEWNFESVWSVDVESTPTLQLPVEANVQKPRIAILSPEANETQIAWNPEIDWDNATTCYYAFGEDSLTNEVDCAQAGHDIPAPSSDGATVLTILGLNSSEVPSETETTEFVFFPNPYTFSSGNGTEESPYRISSCEALSAIQEQPTKHFILANDVECSLLTPIAPYGFEGTFDGDGHTITYTQTDEESIGNGELGLFAFLHNATIQNLNLAGTTTSSYGYPGAVASFTEGTTTLMNIHSAMNITGNSYTGGLIGYVNDGSNGSLTIRSSYVSGSVSSVTVTGGLIGSVDGHTSILDSYFSGSVSGENEVGGLIGQAYGTTSISRSYVSGPVSIAYDSVGGFIGHGLGETISITDSFVDAVITTGDTGYKGSFVGQFNPERINFSNSWYNADTTGISMCGTANDSTTYEDSVGECQHTTNTGQFISNKNQHPFEAWNFTNVWRIVASQYPQLRAFSTQEDIPEPPAPAPVVVNRGGGGGGNGGSRTPIPLPKTTVQKAELPVSQTYSTTSPVRTSVRDLTLTTSGTDVKALQVILIAEDSGPAARALKAITATGYFGTYTSAALAEYQKKQGIAPARGYFGPKTRTVMKTKSVAGVWW